MYSNETDIKSDLDTGKKKKIQALKIDTEGSTSTIIKPHVLIFTLEYNSKYV